MTNDPKALFKKFLRSTDRNVTVTRKQIVEEVFNIHGHFDAFDLWARLRDDTSISFSTIYRTLDLLNNAGLVKKVDLGKTQTHYEHTFGHGEHDHLICLGCGNIIEFSDKSIEERYGFQGKFYKLQVFGQCKKCAEDAD